MYVTVNYNILKITSTEKNDLDSALFAHFSFSALCTQLCVVMSSYCVSAGSWGYPVSISVFRAKASCCPFSNAAANYHSTFETTMSLTCCRGNGSVHLAQVSPFLHILWNYYGKNVCLPYFLHSSQLDTRNCCVPKISCLILCVMVLFENTDK